MKGTLFSPSGKEKEIFCFDSSLSLNSVCLANIRIFGNIYCHCEFRQSSPPVLIASVGHSSDHISLLSEHKAEFSSQNIFIKYTIPGYSPRDAIHFQSTAEIKDFWKTSFQVLAMLFTKEIM